MTGVPGRRTVDALAPRARTVLRSRPDPRAPDRQGRLERSLVRLHGLLVLSFALFTLLPLNRDGAVPDGEVVVRLALTGLHVGLAVDLQRRGERVGQLGVAFLGSALSLSPWLGAIPGDVTAGLAYSSVALCAARLFRTRWFLVALLVTGPMEMVLRHLTGTRATPLPFDAWLLTVALTSSAAVFVDSLEDRARRTEQLDRAARSRELELREARERAAAADQAVRVLHDDVLGALHLLADARSGEVSGVPGTSGACATGQPGDPGPDAAARIRRRCARTVASVRAVLDGADPGPGTDVAPAGEVLR